MKSNNSKEDEKENQKTIVSNDEEKPKILNNLQEIEKLSIEKLEEKISKEIKICKKKFFNIF